MKDQRPGMAIAACGLAVNHQLASLSRVFRSNLQTMKFAPMRQPFTQHWATSWKTKQRNNPFFLPQQFTAEPQNTVVLRPLLVQILSEQQS
jgi:hypothetical protein